ncbi:MAG: DUF393 domain-containing protein [Ignavibacteria bacterium]|nr:DUF393 domain-containing protein [Ignavibacteria bacterium]
MNKPIIFFDGNCNLCNGFVRFLIRIDKKKIFRYLSLNSKTALQLPQLKEYLIPPFQTVILYQKNNLFTQSDAVIEIISQLNYPWKFFWIITFIPKKIRDWFYKIISRNRYKIFGRNDNCELWDESFFK